MKEYIVSAVTVPVGCVYDALVAPAGTRNEYVTDPLIETYAPPAGAAAVSVTVPIALSPPTTAAGVKENALILTEVGLTVPDAVMVVPL